MDVPYSFCIVRSFFELLKYGEIYVMTGTLAIFSVRSMSCPRESLQCMMQCSEMMLLLWNCSWTYDNFAKNIESTEQNNKDVCLCVSPSEMQIRPEKKNLEKNFNDASFKNAFFLIYSPQRIFKITRWQCL